MLQHIKSQEDWEEKSLGAKGFTLIELLVVIVILGILAAVVVFAVAGITDHGQVSACESEAATLRTAIESYDAQYTGYPTSLSELYTSGGTQNFLDSSPATLINWTADTTGATTGTFQWAGACATEQAKPGTKLPATP